MSYADEMEPNIVSWQEHSQIVRTSFMDGAKQGRENVMRLLAEKYEQTKSPEIKTIIDKINEDEIEKNTVILMRPGPTWHKGLEDLCKLFPEKAVVAEIGCYSGESTEIFAKNVGMLFAIDPWKAEKGKENSQDVRNYNFRIDIAEKIFDRMREKYGNIVKLKGFDYEFLDCFPDGFFDAVYVDANHYYEAVKKNIADWKLKVKKGGFICGHDYYDVTPDVVKAVEETLGKPDHTFEDSSWAVMVK